MATQKYLTFVLFALIVGHGTESLEFEECASTAEIGVYVASASNCSKYIYCAGAGSFEAECLDGHYYDEHSERCMDKELVKRCQDQQQTGSKPPARKPIAKAQPLSITLRHLPNAGPCYPYMVCYEGAGILKACTPAHLVSCNRRQSQEIITTCQAGVYGFMPHSRHCAYFYYCSNGHKLIHRCPLNYTWHAERRSCVQESQQKCYNQRMFPSKKREVKAI
ncbi:hypothetical protein KR018_003751 [Drosophila ironensis]|nr:hypothetical protein KR018_003751 [Drosophila ironensis]